MIYMTSLMKSLDYLQVDLTWSIYHLGVKYTSIIAGNVIKRLHLLFGSLIKWLK